MMACDDASLVPYGMVDSYAYWHVVYGDVHEKRLPSLQPHAHTCSLMHTLAARLTTSCRYASNPTMLGKDPKTLLLPSSEPLRSMVLAAAERLGLEQCCGRLAPPGDIVNQLTHE